MKIVIIGPDGAGKTVFLAMLSRYITEQAADLFLSPSDFKSRDYIASAQKVLDNGDWPRSTPMGSQRKLKWKFGIKGQAEHDLEMLDASGQDFREILKADDSAEIPPALSDLKKIIDCADVLLFLLDLEGFLRKRDLQVESENAWLLDAFLRRPEWRYKKRIVIVSKADLFKPMLSIVGDDVKAALESDGPSALKQVIAANDSVPYVAVSSIQTITKLEEDGTPRRVPLTPISVGDFEAVLVHLRKLMRRTRLMNYILSSVYRPGLARLKHLRSVLLRIKLKDFLYSYSVSWKLWIVIISLIIVVKLLLDYPWFRQRFRVSFLTGTESHAGTDAQVYLILSGDKGTSERLKFDGRGPSLTHNNSFESGQTDTFIVTSKRVGMIQNVEVGHDNSEPNAEWSLKRIEIDDLRNDEVLTHDTFEFGDWLDTTPGHRLSVVIQREK